ncbi:hypothetical protein ACWF82_19425 [Nocardia sp. NPDC055053]
MTQSWNILSTLVLRSAGFPWQLVESLRYHHSADLVADIIDLEHHASALAQTLRGVRLSRGDQSKLRTFRPLAARGDTFPEQWLTQWNKLTSVLAEKHEQLGAATAADTTAVDLAFTALRADERVAEAIACSSPPAYRDLSRGVKGARIRRQLASYAQRLGAKSETMSFFGPINYADLAPHEPGESTLTWLGHRVIRDREAHTAARVLQAINQAINDDDELLAGATPRRKTMLGKASGILALVDGHRTVRDIARDAALPLDDVLDQVRTGVGSGRLTHDLVPPSTLLDPWGWLDDRLSQCTAAGHPSRAHSIVTTVRELLTAYPSAPAQAKLALQNELDSMIESGRASDDRFYNDRVVVHEAAVGTTAATLRGDLAADLLDVVAPALDLLAYQADLTRESTNRALAARLGNRVVPLATALREVGDLTVHTADWLTAAITAALHNTDPDTVAVDLAEHLDIPPVPRNPVLCSIDVLPAVADLARYRPGSTPLVLGDIHDAALLTPWALRFHPDSARALLERDTAIEQALGNQTAVNVIPRRSTGLPPLEFPGLVLELGGTAADPTRARIGLDALQVRSDGAQAILVDRTDPERPLLFHNGELDSGLHTALALPRIRRAVLPDLSYVPRLTWRNAVLSRRVWKLPSDAVPQPNAKIGESSRLLATARLCADRKLPTRFFAKSPAERKPIFVDTATPSLLDALTRLAATAETLTVSEVLPAPEDAWLRDGELRFAAELRCVYLRKGANQI